MSRLESDYYSFMGFDPEHARKVLEFYVPFFGGGGKVLELAPGRGEFLGLLREAGIEAAGVDVDEGMVAVARETGHDVALGDAVDYLHEGVEPGSLGGVFSSHLLEHLDTPRVERLIAGARRALAPGGTFVAVTPNPACYAVLGNDFWRDPTHVRFYDLPLLEFLCVQAGMTVASSGVNPVNVPGPPPEFRTPEVVVHPGLDDSIQSAVATATEALRHGPPGRRTRQPAHDPTWAYVLAHVVKTLSDRLAETQEALRAVRRAHERLINSMYQGNDIYVVAHAGGPAADAGTSGADTDPSSGAAGTRRVAGDPSDPSGDAARDTSTHENPTGH